MLEKIMDVVLAVNIEDNKQKTIELLHRDAELLLKDPNMHFFGENGLHNKLIHYDSDLGYSKFLKELLLFCQEKGKISPLVNKLIMGMWRHAKTSLLIPDGSSIDILNTLSNTEKQDKEKDVTSLLSTLNELDRLGIEGAKAYREKYTRGESTPDEEGDNLADQYNNLFGKLKNISCNATFLLYFWNNGDFNFLIPERQKTNRDTIGGSFRGEDRPFDNLTLTIEFFQEVTDGGVVF